MAIEAGPKVRAYDFVCEFSFYRDDDSLDGTLGCNQVSGLEQGIETSNIPAGKANTRQKTIPDSVNHLEVEFSRGMDASGGMWNWWQFTKEVADTHGRVLRDYQKSYKRDVTVISQARAYKLIDAYPTNYAVNEFDAQNSDILFESLTLDVQDITRRPI